MNQLRLDEVKALAEGYSVVPVSRELFADIKTPIAVLRNLKSVSSCCFLLESVEGGEKWGRYSFLGFDPLVEITCKDHELTIKNTATVKLKTGDPNSYIRAMLSEYKSPRLPNLPPFTGGLVGYFAYDYIKYSEPKLKFGGKDDAGFNDVDLMLFDKVIAFDHLKQKIVLIINIKTNDLEANYNRAQMELDQLAALVKKDAPEACEQSKLLIPFTAERSQEEYAMMVKRAKLYIKEGDIFQVVPSNRREAKFSGSLLNTYRVLRTTNPSPYMFYFSGHDLEITGASPETLVKLQNGKLATYPIAGTKPRGGTEAEDRALEQELLSDEKELSEHDMLVDLGRNDLGKVSEFGTVKVKDYRMIERYSHVMHIASTVTGILAEGKDALDAITATLPAGTLSGAPKIRAVEIIHELEGSLRGIYGGAIGYLDFTGNMDVCIAIRMAVKKGDKVYIRSGGGVVEGSDPDAEYQESLNKAQAMIDAVTLSGEVVD